MDAGHTWIQIVGMVGDVKQYGLDRGAADEIYFALAQTPCWMAIGKENNCGTDEHCAQDYRVAL